jgi:hypothetical protein
MGCSEHLKPTVVSSNHLCDNRGIVAVGFQQYPPLLRAQLRDCDQRMTAGIDSCQQTDELRSYSTSAPLDDKDQCFVPPP